MLVANDVVHNFLLSEERPQPEAMPVYPTKVFEASLSDGRLMILILPVQTNHLEKLIVSKAFFTYYLDVHPQLI